MNEVRRLERNLLNQKFDYYLPEISIKKINSNPKAEVLFPGYIFVNTNLKNYSALKYTIGIRNIIKFGNNIPYMSDEDIESMKMVEEESKINPLPQQIEIGKDAFISRGSLKGNIVKICSLPCRERVETLITFFGSLKRVTIPIKDLVF